MKKIILVAIIALGMVSGIFAMGEEKTSATTVEPSKDSPVEHTADASFQKQGFITTKWCAEQGLFADCRLESIVCGEGGCFMNWEFGDKMKTELVVYVLDDLQYYKIQPTGNFSMSELIEKGMAKDLVTIIGKYDEKTNAIIASEFKAPPPAGKSFFKGCL